MRAFLSIPLPEYIKHSLADLQSLLSKSEADVKWVAPERMHVTLKFLDKISLKQIERLIIGMHTIGESKEPVTIRMGKLGAFPSMKSAKVIWVGIDQGSRELSHLAQSIELLCRGMKLHEEERSFAAHITIGRVKSNKNRSELTSILQGVNWSTASSFVAEEFVLYQSTLTASGPTHSPISEFKFG